MRFTSRNTKRNIRIMNSIIDKIIIPLILLITIILFFNIYDWFIKKYDYHKTRYKLKNGEYFNEVYKFPKEIEPLIVKEHIVNSKKKFESKYNLEVNQNVSISYDNDNFIYELQIISITYSYDI